MSIFKLNLLSCTRALLLLPLFINPSSCFILNHTIEDGLYQFQWGKAGDSKRIPPNITRYFFDDSDSIPYTKGLSNIDKLLTKRECRLEPGTLDEDDRILATRALMNWCEQNSLKSKSVVLSVVKNVIVYVSFWEWGRRDFSLANEGYCSAKDLQYAFDHMDEKCGPGSTSVMYTFILNRYFGRCRRMDNMFWGG